MGVSLSKNRFPVLKVEDSNFEVKNGLNGMKRDIILRLCWILWKDEKKVRNIMGMCYEHFTWKNHSLFLKNRPLNIIVSLRPNPKGKCSILNTPSGIHVSFTDELRTVFINRAVATGVFRWTIRIAYGKKKGMESEFYIGAAPPDLLNQYDDTYIGSEEGTAGFVFHRCEGSFEACVCGVEGSFDLPADEIKVPDKSLVSIEADCAAHTLTFFIGKAKVPRGISGVYLPALHLGVTGRIQPIEVEDTKAEDARISKGDESSFDSVCFRRLPSATTSAIRCTMHAMIVRVCKDNG